MEKVGVFLCTGCDIGSSLNIEGFQEIVEEQGATHYATHECLCSKEGVASIHAAIDDGTVDGVLIAACSSRAMTAEFTFDPTKVAVERASLREQCIWTHEAGDDDTQMLAEDLLRMGTIRVVKMELTKPVEEEIDRTVLVVGGGLAGLNAAKAAAAMGHPVVLVEKDKKLGGYMSKVKDVVPEVPPYDRLAKNEIAGLIAEVEKNDDIRVLKPATVKAIKGQPGQFDVEVKGDTFEEQFRVGAIVQATGSRGYDASKLEHLGYGSDNVVTSQQLEAMLFSGKLAKADGKKPSRITFIQCAGSRDPNHLPYCSSECCATSLRQVAMLKRDYPDVECAVVYRDLRTPGQLEHFYLGVQESTNAMLTRGEVAKVESNGGGKLTVNIDRSLLGDEMTLESDMVVLATGLVPNAADGEAIRELRDAYGRIAKNESETQVKAAQELVDKLKDKHEGTEILNLKYRQGPDMPSLRYSFPDSHYICFPYETRRTGIYAAGTLHAPMDAVQAAEDGWGAAMKATQCINATTRGEAVHPRAGDQSIASFFLQRCTQCKRCTEECPFGTLNEDVKGTPEYNQLRCRRCGICLGACPERIISFPEYSVDAVASMIKAMSVPEEWDEKPRYVVFACENDALPAIDEAASRGLKWNPWVRIIPVRCLGAVNTVWIADSLSSGIDGVMLIGCKRGDDYQCHYIKGSELCNTRMSNVKETLQRLTLESERVRIVELGRDEWHRIPDLLDEIGGIAAELGYNPYKGF